MVRPFPVADSSETTPPEAAEKIVWLPPTDVVGPPTDVVGPPTDVVGPPNARNGIISLRSDKQ